MPSTIAGVGNLVMIKTEESLCSQSLHSCGKKTDGNTPMRVTGTQ